MSFVIGRRSSDPDRPTGHLGRYRAVDGSTGAPLHVDFDAPHAAVVVGKRGYGKSYTLGVFAEELARTAGVAPVVVDPMGAFESMAEGSGSRAPPDEAPSSAVTTVVARPTVDPAVLEPRAWCDLLDLSPESGAGTLVWQAAQERATLTDMREHVSGADADPAAKRAAVNHLTLASSWGVFDAAGIDATDLVTGGVTVLDLSGLDAAPGSAVVSVVGDSLYRAGIDGRLPRLPWLLVDEAHAFFSRIAGATLERLLTRGRAPGVSLVLATQRPSAVPEVALSQADLLVSHRLTSAADLAALESARPVYLTDDLREAVPDEPGEALVVDDATETVHTAQIRRRETPHSGDSPRARERADSGG